MQSDLIGLRAELHKKRAEASKYGSGQRGLPKRSGEKPSRSTSFNIQNAGLAIRIAKDKQQEKEETPSDEKARSILEKKAQLYEKLHGGIETLEDDELNEKYLVNFQRKIVDEVSERKRRRENEKALEEEQREREESQPDDYKPKGKDEEWVEYTDVLGRTRECMRKDLPNMVEQDKNLLGENEDDAEREAELLSGEQYRAKLHEKWEREADINALKKDLHYQDVLYDEARVHGTGYMKFSHDEKERKSQMDMLKEMHEEAQRSEQTKKISVSKKQKLLEARLEKVRQRKRLKLGLPIKDDSRLKTPPASDGEEEEETIGPPPPATLNEDPSKNAEETATPKPKQSKTREWDIGKEGVEGPNLLSQEEWLDQQKKRVGGPSIISQEEWLNQQRNQRMEEFAPPSVYNSNKRHRGPNCTPTSQREPVVNEQYQKTKIDPSQEKRNHDFAPPSTYEYYGPSSFSGRKNYSRPNYRTMEEAIAKGLSSLRKMTD